jgi:hypothetical protein
MMCCDENYKMKKVFWGVLILLFGALWYLRDTGTIVLEPFWPIVIMLVGLVVLLKGMLFKPTKKR